MTISREKCLEMGDEIYGKTYWNEAMTERLEALINRAYAEGQRDMRERAVQECTECPYDVGWDLKDIIAGLGIE